MTDGTSLWPRVAALPVRVERYELGPLTADWTERISTEIRLIGRGTDGVGEDSSPYAHEHRDLVVSGPRLKLAGDWTVESFCQRVSSLDQWEVPPSWPPARGYRNWGYEAAALDLALRQAGVSLHHVLGLDPRPVRFVNSLGLGTPPTADRIHARLAHYPGLRFKLDATVGWTAPLTAELAATGAVDILDLKGLYGHAVADLEGLQALYDLVLAQLPDVLIEDPHGLPEIAGRLVPHRHRVSYDAPIHAASDIAAHRVQPAAINVKPGRIGTLRALFELYAHCEAQGVRMYGGGETELGAGRGQIQLLASLFHPDAPNDVAPAEYNAAELAPGLCPGPLDPPDLTPGFRWNRLGPSNFDMT